MPYREFIVHQDVHGAKRQAHVVRLASLLDRYTATAFRIEPDGTRLSLVLRGERDMQIAADLFYSKRRAMRRDLAMRVTQALQAGLYDPDDSAEKPKGLSIGANLAGYPLGYPNPREDDLADWSEVFDLKQQPFRVFERDLPAQPGLPARCTVSLVSTLSGYVARLTCELEEPVSPWGYLMPLVSREPWREHVDAATFFRDRIAYRDRLVARVEAAISEGKFIRISDYKLPNDGLEDFDWIVRANLDPRLWPNGYPEAVMDDLSDWRDAEKTAKRTQDGPHS
ncbi:hypothetical protein [Burkholderia territorii]|uniref:hypothetical protein n=1 Tax=Burkholderia territorii TaxID=1503055 RepID=UPI0007581D17|nr:hypothetical protein [Burkholderia territorii]